MTAFSNATEFEYWADKWCYRCSKDDFSGELQCPILNTCLLDGEVPAEWSSGKDDLRDRYHCSEFEPR